MLPTLALPLTLNVPNVPTLVILNSTAVDNVPIILPPVILPVAVIDPDDIKLPPFILKIRCNKPRCA